MPLPWAIVIGALVLAAFFLWRLYATEDWDEAVVETILGAPIVAVGCYLLVVAVAFVAGVVLSVVAAVVVIGALLAAAS